MREFIVDVHGVACKVIDYNLDEDNLALDAPVVVAFHGRMDNSGSFLPLCSHIDACRLLLVDIPGHGHSQHNGRGNFFNYLDLIDIIFQVLSRLELERVVLLGHSMGGAYSLLFSGIFPEYVRGVITIEALGPIAVERDDFVAAMRKCIHARNTPRPLPEYSGRQEMLTHRAKIAKLDTQMIAPIVERGIVEKSDAAVTWSIDPRLMLPMLYDIDEQTVQHVLANVTCNVLYLESQNGMFADDKYIDRAVMSQRRKHIKHLRHVDIEGGHYPHLEAPEVIASYINTWLVDIDS